MIQQSPFPPIFTMERVTPAVEAALGEAMLARARLDKSRHMPPTQPKVMNSETPPNERQMELLRLIQNGRTTSSLIGISLNTSTRDISNRMRTLIGREWVEVVGTAPINKSMRRAIYSLTPQGEKWLTQ